MGEWLLQELKREAAPRASEWRDLLHAPEAPGRDRAMAAALQRGPAPPRSQLPAAGAGDQDDGGSFDDAHKDSERLRRRPELTSKLDQKKQAGQVYKRNRTDTYLMGILHSPKRRWHSRGHMSFPIVGKC